MSETKNIESETPAAVAGAAICSVESVNRQVIENQLLTALDDKSKVAILATEGDLELLISALFMARNSQPMLPERYNEFRRDLEQLKSAAFPPNGLDQPQTPRQKP